MLAVLAVACAEPEGWIDISPSSVQIPIASILRLTAIVRDASGRPVSDAPVTWSSSDRAIAAVDLRGLVTGISQGESSRSR